MHGLKEDLKNIVININNWQKVSFDRHLNTFKIWIFEIRDSSKEENFDYKIPISKSVSQADKQ